MLHLIHTAKAPSRLAQLAQTHPYLFFMLLLVGMPMGILLAMSLVAAVVMLPVSFFMGWL